MPSRLDYTQSESITFVDVSERIHRLLEARGLSQTELANAIGVEPGTINGYIQGTQFPGSMPCLLLAGLASPRDRATWLAEAGLGGQQKDLILFALGGEETGISKRSRRQEDLIALFSDWLAADEAEWSAYKKSLERMLREWRAAKKSGRKAVG